MLGFGANHTRPQPCHDKAPPGPDEQQIDHHCFGPLLRRRFENDFGTAVRQVSFESDRR